MDRSEFVFSVQEDTDDDTDFFRLQPSTFHERDGYGAALNVNVYVSGFSGQHNPVWCDLRDLNHFFNELKELERTRQGSATLESMSAPSEYNELLFRIYSTTRAGHMAVKVVLQRVA
ncbi:MAG: hypothetical protein K8I30_09045, partial [Anaerolineae bacterium]|nr:hypothetical protein [Anaerolineae bacterium]